MKIKSETENNIDIIEDDIVNISPSLLSLLLKDKTTNENIKWGTNDYELYGVLFNEKSQITVELITGNYSFIIQPRASKSKYIQEQRIKNRAEVFTPSCKAFKFCACFASGEFPFTLIGFVS